MQLPRILDERYQIERLLGQGGIGEVYYGIDLQTQQPIAIKALKPHIIQKDPQMVERFRREGEALRELNHPNIVKMLALVEDDSQHFIVMEYVEGGSLYDLLKREGRLSLDRVLYIALDLSDALTRAHRLQIIHRDIKPANVLLATDGTPRLTDFGAARMQKLSALTTEGGVIGTVSYLSPETCQGEPIDARADIWAFGVLLFEMLTGKRPFDQHESLATLIAIVKNPLPDLVALLPEAPPKMVNLIYRMLEKDPNERIGSMRLVGAELEAIIQQADSGVRQAIDLIYRMLERDPDAPISGVRLVDGKLESSAIHKPDRAEALPTRKPPISLEQFEKPGYVTPATAPHQAPPRQPTTRRTVYAGIGLITLVVVLVAVILLLL
jgi:serine/threonine protein kinase